MIDEKSVKQRGYFKGYAAGKKRGKFDAEQQQLRDLRTAAENAFWQQCFVHFLNGTLIGGTWGTGGKKWTKGGDFADGCAGLADIALRTAIKRGRV